MFKRIISSILIIIILTLWMPIQAMQEVFKSVATDTEVTEEIIQTEWEYTYKGEVQTFEVPYSGLYKIEVYGAQGKGSNGAKGSQAEGIIKLKANDVLSIYVGGRSTGYNGGGSEKEASKTDTKKQWTHSCNNTEDPKSGYQETTVTYTGIAYSGGGATDIRIGGTELANRVIVARWWSRRNFTKRNS